MEFKEHIKQSAEKVKTWPKWKRDVLGASEFRPDPKKDRKKKKVKYGSDPKYLEWLKTQPCCNPNCHGCVLPSIPAHQRILGNGGTGIKPPDKDAVPLGYWCHTEEHQGSVTFWGQGSKPMTKIFIQKLCDDHVKRYGEFLKCTNKK